MTHQPLKSDEVTPTLTQEPIGETVPEPTRGEAPDPRPLATVPHHPPQGLLARWLLAVLPAPLPFRRRSEYLNLDCEYVVVRLYAEHLTAVSKRSAHVRIERKPVPMPPLPLHSDTLPIEIDVLPGAGQDL